MAGTRFDRHEIGCMFNTVRPHRCRNQGTCDNPNYALAFTNLDPVARPGVCAMSRSFVIVRQAFQLAAIPPARPPQATKPAGRVVLTLPGPVHYAVNPRTAWP